MNITEIEANKWKKFGWVANDDDEEMDNVYDDNLVDFLLT
jgi:hypothetical protein